MFVSEKARERGVKKFVFLCVCEQDREREKKKVKRGDKVCVCV